MDKEKKTDFNQNWYDIWMKQSQLFFETAEKNLKNMFDTPTPIDPEAHAKEINAWLENLKKQWQFTELNMQQKEYEAYWRMCAKMSNEAAEMILAQWTLRAKEKNPIKNIRELYDLWLDCCEKIYEKAMQSKAYQEAYGDYMNAVLNFWQSTMPK